MINKIQKLSLRLENVFILSVVRQGLAMLIPFILTGCMAAALLNLPIPGYTDFLSGGFLSPVYYVLKLINYGYTNLLSIAIVITLSISYAIEENETNDTVVFYVLISLICFGVQLNFTSDNFDINSLGTTGCFGAISITLIACFLYSKLKCVSFLTLKKYTSGMDYIFSLAISSLLPFIIIVSAVALVDHIILSVYDVSSIYQLNINTFCRIFDNLKNSFGSGLLYTFLLHLLWIFGIHGSFVLEGVATNNFSISGTEIFSKGFFDTYITIGGCGTTICVFLILLIFYRKTTMGNLAKIGGFTVIFNINEFLTFGLPIILNPLLAIPFLLTPTVLYIVAYTATYTGIVPPVTNSVFWTTPALISGYQATGSIRGAVLQLVCIAIGVLIYYPFIKLYKEMSEASAKEQLKNIVCEFQKMESENSNPGFLLRADKYGRTARMLKHDLESAINNHELFMLYQPQVDSHGKCIGAEELLRWNHPLYGMIYPPLIIYLAKEGNLLEQLEREILSITAKAIRKTMDEYGDDFKISVNITAKSLLWDIENCIHRTLEENNVPADKMWIEITEQDVISNSDSIQIKLKTLSDSGHTLLIDDFGMGHTSLIYLQSNYFGIVKLDGSIVKNVLTNTTDQKIISSIVDLGKKLNVQVIAEYVETEEQRDKLKSLGCLIYQGYLYSKPVSIDEFIEYIKKTNLPVS